ncbi:1,3-beta-D-glucan synthase catalytic subunit [Lactarius hatsudake]|nr:1,3-beta-D-glucan synthase catalytic subunit [Lactarius hatsudake]
MNNMSQYDRMWQIALYLLCWGEAAQVRFVPKCLCFIVKCADDYYRSPECQNRIDPVPDGLYLRAIIKPLYCFIRDQSYESVDGKFVRERDHDRIIGYDDVYQLFWYPEGIARIVLTRLIPPAQRFMRFDRIDWNCTFFKMYDEKRSFGHLLVNFNRIWVIHVSLFWFYTAYNAPTIYQPDRRHSPALTRSTTALGGAVATVIMVLARLVEFSYIPTTWNNTSHLRRLLFLLVTLALTAGPTFYIAIVENQADGGRSLALILNIAQYFISEVATLLFGIMPSGQIFGDRVAGKYLASQTFTASYPLLHSQVRLGSVFLWFLIFGCKFTESYFFLTLAFCDPIRVMAGMKIQHCQEQLFGYSLCHNQAIFTLTIMFIMDLVLFFLDTFLWYIIWNTVYSIARSFMLGLSIWMPWRDLFARLLKHIHSNFPATSDLEVRYKPKVLVSDLECDLISMYREHLLSIDHVQKLLYHQVDTPDGRSLRAPRFFVAQTDKGFKGSFFLPLLPEALPVDAMPTFTVLTPHYNEKILLSLREIIKESDINTRITLLEYLKQLRGLEWENFILDGAFPDDEKSSSKLDDLPFYCIGFKSAALEFTLRTRIWASLCFQTLYHTAIKLLFRVKSPEVVQMFGGNTDKLERELEHMARHKFKFVVSMQQYSKFNKEEHENAEFLLRAYPELQTAYLEEEPRSDGGEPHLYSALIDGHSEFNPQMGRHKPKFRIELPGNPILMIIFYRGEYLQLIDANQDNYLEECLKICNVLAEFGEYSKEFKTAPVAIAHMRSLVWIGGKLHYGHPDFLNATFMNTCGGISKAQKGLHLNEDIYTGMNMFGRGGRIKHTEYYQCGKGCNLGFGTILNFQIKIGTSMGEQMLSHEYYYLSTQLPIDRFLTFYYSHPGFYINNMLIILSVQLFIVTSAYFPIWSSLAHLTCISLYAST